jgi:hypothetical protein
VLVVTAPLAAVGAMALTVYSVQIVIIWWWSRTGVDLLSYPSNEPLGVMVLCALAAATLWRALFGRGPLERVFAGVARKAFPAPGRASGTGPDGDPDIGPGAGPDADPDTASDTSSDTDTDNDPVSGTDKEPGAGPSPTSARAQNVT